MKRFLFSILIVLTIVLINKDKIVIPKEAIRIRVIASSDEEYDQKIKKEVKSTLEKDLYNLLKDTRSIDNARTIITNNLVNIDKEVNDILKENNYNKKYDINFGYNYFPKKEYKGITYEDGMYESLVVTLGEGKGSNWWCVMYPPFCLLEAQDNNTTNIKYKWYINDLINKYLG